MTDQDLTAPEAALLRALDQIEELNKLPPDDRGHRWDNSDLVAQEIMGARSALRAMPALLSELAPYKDELLKIAETVGEGDDPFAAWEAIEVISAALEAERAESARLREIISGAGVNLWDRAELSERDESGNQTILLWHPSGVPFLSLAVQSHAPKMDAGHIAFAMSDLLDVFMARERARAFLASLEGDKPDE